MRFDVEAGVKEINKFLVDQGYTPRDADGADFQRGSDRTLRFKTGTVHGEVTITVWVNDRQQKQPIRILGDHQIIEAKTTLIMLIDEWASNGGDEEESEDDDA